ncbi:hypothetical protein ACO22_00564 [Paracoccidioides brasiliensis]|uniref:Uncharacterized protein n=1 Tax=Paracoccidioides brasiliensis TaxID=121759 RepID=A0A1D2JP92_PARBR|nr:hypothetical protein ACO22_00564 [Paracoccidioides brasiliensis]
MPPTNNAQTVAGAGDTDPLVLADDQITFVSSSSTIQSNLGVQDIRERSPSACRKSRQMNKNVVEPWSAIYSRPTATSKHIEAQDARVTCSCSRLDGDMDEDSREMRWEHFSNVTTYIITYIQYAVAMLTQCGCGCELTAPEGY